MTISQVIEQHTADISGFQTKRDYISMSHAFEDADTLLKYYNSGFEDSLAIRLKCYKGYQWERDLMTRFKAAYPAFLYYPEKEIEISAFGGLVKGHVEGTFEGYPCDCKTVPLDEHLPKDGKVSKRIYWQLQSYMRYMEREKALVIFESRETGHLRDFWIRRNPAIQSAIHDKFQFVTQTILSKAA